MKKIIIDNFLLKVTNTEANHIDKLSMECQMKFGLDQIEAMSKFAEVCDALVKKYSNKEYIERIYTTMN